MPTTASSDPKRILVVEDDATVRVMLERVLSARGHTVQAAPTSHEALAFVLYDLPAPPDIAVLDIVLPGTNGVALAHALRKHFPSIMFVFVTGWLQASGVELMEQARKLGVVLEKPFSLPVLLAAIAGRRGE